MLGPPRPQEVVTAEQAADRLQELGHRMTPQRLTILEAVFDVQGHVTAEDVYDQVVRRYPHVSFSTVYRTLEMLRDLGFITQTDLGGGRVQYQATGKARHHHLVCQVCGGVAEVDEALFAGLERELNEKYGFDPILHHFAIFGRCRRCR